MKNQNIIWFILDGVRNYHCPNDPEKMGKPPIVDKLALDGIEFLQATTSATSTIMSVTSMMTAIPAYYLSRNFDDIRVDKSNFESLGSILETHGYNVYNISFLSDMRRNYWNTFLRPVNKKYWPKAYKAYEHWSNEPINPIAFSLLDSNEFKSPFFLYVHYNFRRDISCNERVEQLLTRLIKENLYDDSIIIMNSDHGIPDSERRDYFKWLDERGLFFNRHDLIMTDDNICVPLVIKYPGCKAGKKINNIVGTIDITPTILDLLDINFGKNQKIGSSFRGETLIPLINDHNIEHYNQRKIRTDTRYIAQTDRITSIRGNGYKYINYRDVPGIDSEQFLDLSKDIYENNNLIASQEKKYIDKINEYKNEYDFQELDSYTFQLEFLNKKFKKNWASSNINIKDCNNILVIGSCNYSFMKIIIDIIHSYFGKDIRVDIFLERDNPTEYHELNKIGYTNNIFAHHSFNAEEFRNGYLSTFIHYDLLIIPLTDYKKDFRQSQAKLNLNEMQIGHPQEAISSRQIRDYKEIIKIVKLCKPNNKIYIDYNMNFYFNPKLIIIERLIKKMYAKRDIYMSKPLEIFKDIKRLIQQK